MIDKLNEYSRHVQDEAVTTATLLEDAAKLLTEAREIIVQLTDAYAQTLRANGYEPNAESVQRGRDFIWRRLTSPSR